MGERILVLGGGVIGLSCAFEALQNGFQVTVIEARSCGGQASGAAAGMLAPYSENIEFPDDFFRLSLESLRLYPEWQQAVREISGEDFEYTNSGSLYAVYHEADLSAIEQRAQWQSEFGAQAEVVTGSRLAELEPELSSEVRAALYIPQESHVHAPDYVRALNIACRKLGADIREHCGQAVPELTAEGVRVICEDGSVITGDRLVVSVGAWGGEMSERLGIKMPIYPIRGQICAYDTPVRQVHHMVFCSQGYLVSKRNGQLVCGASEDLAGFDTTVTDKGIARLEAWNGKLFPFVKNKPTTLRWAGLRPATQDGYPLLGELSHDQRVILACGHYRNGILLSPVTGKIVGDLLTGRADRVSLHAFTPERFGRVEVDDTKREETFA